MSAHRAHATIEAGQPWYSIGLLCLSFGLLILLFAPPLSIGVVAGREFGAGLLIGVGLAMLSASLWKSRRHRREGQA